MSTRNYLQEIDQFESHYQYDGTYMRELLEFTPEGFIKFDHFMPLASHQGTLDPETYWIAKLAAMQVEDCGDCLQLNIRMALENNVSKQVIESVLNGGNGLASDLRDLYDFATHVADHAVIENELMERINASFNKTARLEIALCIATAKVFPTIKRTLGYTKNCRLVEIKV